MARRVTEEDFQAIFDPAGQRGSASAHEIVAALGGAVPLRTVQYRLRLLVKAGRLVQQGKGPSARYALPESAPPQALAGEARIEEQGSLFVRVSKEGAAIQEHVRKPKTARPPVGYDRKFLDGYRPNATAYLRRLGTPQTGEQAAGT